MYIYIGIYSDLCGGSPLSHHTNPHTTGCVCVSVGVCMCMCVCGVCVFMCVCVVKEGLPSHTTQSHTRESVYECACVCVCVCVCMCVCACKWANIRSRCGENLYIYIFSFPLFRSLLNLTKKAKTKCWAINRTTLISTSKSVDDQKQLILHTKHRCRVAKTHSIP